MQLIATKHRLGMCMSVCFWYPMPEGHSSQLLNPVQQQSGAQVFGLSAFVSNTLIMFLVSHTILAKCTLCQAVLVKLPACPELGKH